MSYAIAALGFMALIVLHELGHFFAAKAVGMRVERFSLFFPPFLYRRQGKGETEYTIGAIPLGGYVKITGMNPHEELAPEVAPRAYFRQKPWKRIVVILAGPAVNLVIAFLLLTGLVLHAGLVENGSRVTEVSAGEPAARVLQPGDQIVAVDGRRGDLGVIADRINSHMCAGEPRPDCRAQTPAELTIVRAGETLTRQVRPVFDAESERMLVGFRQDVVRSDANVPEAAGEALNQMWLVTDRTVTVIANIFDAEQRRELSGVVGSYEVTRQAVSIDVETALFVIALISLSLGVINLFPFLPLDGGHVFWAAAEKLRGKPIPFSVMERSGFVGFALVMVFFVIGFSNDINTLLGPGFDLQR